MQVLTGPTGSGKTTFLSQLSLDYCEQQTGTLWVPPPHCYGCCYGCWHCFAAGTVLLVPPLSLLLVLLLLVPPLSLLLVLLLFVSPLSLLLVPALPYSPVSF